MGEKTKSVDSVSASVTSVRRHENNASAGGVFHVKCHSADGVLKWEAQSHNLVVDQGLQDMNNKYFGGSVYTASFFLGLIAGPGSGTTYSGNDTMTTHPGWTEFTDYTGTRKAMAFGAANFDNPSVVPNTSVAFSITATGIVAGAFLCTTTSGTGGILFSEADFQSPGDRSVQSGDILNVAYTFSLAAS
jgi:hypothetical protein